MSLRPAVVACVVVAVCFLTNPPAKEVNLEFPFEIEDVENIEMYHYVGTPGQVEKKVIEELFNAITKIDDDIIENRSAASTKKTSSVRIGIVIASVVCVFIIAGTLDQSSLADAQHILSVAYCPFTNSKA